MKKTRENIVPKNEKNITIAKFFKKTFNFEKGATTVSNGGASSKTYSKY